jgi:hypothetical protein
MKRHDSFQIRVASKESLAYVASRWISPCFSKVLCIFIATRVTYLCAQETDSEQIITGLGLGAVLGGPTIAAQTVLSDADISIGLSFLQFISFFAGSTFITVAQTLLENGLVSGLKNILPNLDPSTISGGGASAVRELVTPYQLPVVLAVYNDSLRSIWYLGLGLACLVFLASWGFEWRSVKAKPKDDVEIKV